MPELPDLIYVLGKLREGLLGRHVSAERVKEPVVLRFAVRGNLSLLLGRPLADIFRKSHFLVFRFEGLDLAVNPMLAGGIDLLSPEFTRERFVSLLRHRRDQVRVFLLDKKALDSLGNAYADEVLFEAGIHPKTFCRSLSHDDGVRLHDAIVKVMT